MNEEILKFIEQHDNEARKLRQYLHEHPEISAHEKSTSKFLKEIFSKKKSISRKLHKEYC